MLKFSNRAATFSINVAKHFLAIDGFFCASALAYTTILSIVPLMVLSIGIVSAFTPFQSYRKAVSTYLFKHFLPASAETIQYYLERYATQFAQLSAAGLFFSIVTAVFLLFTIESVLDRVWRVKNRRHGFNAFLLYWTILTLVPPAIVTAFAISLFLVTLPYISSFLGFFKGFVPLLYLASLTITFCCLAFLYKILPATYVRLKGAVIGAAVASIIFEALKIGFSYYITYFSDYGDIYGAVAAIPIFLLWLYLSWLVVIFGATIAYAIQRGHA